MANAVVFAYHNVGVRCLKALLAQGIDVKLVVTYTDNPQERIWFSSVRAVAEEYALPVITPDNPNTPEVMARIAAYQPDFLFSFYYRHMLSAEVLALAAQGAYNMHGSLLPHYRGRAPVNWAVLHGATQSGATLHVMNEKPDNGAIVDQTAVPILPDDTAQEVFDKVTVAAEITLVRCLPDLVAGRAQLHIQDLSQGGYFGGRRAEDGRIDWRNSAQTIHNLVRAVTAPYPGAFSALTAGRLTVWRTQLVTDPNAQAQGLFRHAGQYYVRCGDGQVVRLCTAQLNDLPLSDWDFSSLPLPDIA